MSTILTYISIFMVGGFLGAAVMAVVQINARPAGDDYTGEQL
jgi:hypothetical protein